MAYYIRWEYYLTYYPLFHHPPTLPTNFHQLHICLYIVRLITLTLYPRMLHIYHY